MIRRHAEYARLREEMEKLGPGGFALPLETVCYRYCLNKYARASGIMSGEGAYRAGGRWNAPGAFHAVYCSSSAELGHREYFAALKKAGIPDYRAMPVTGRALRVKLKAALDLRNEIVLRHLGMDGQDILDDPWKSKNEQNEESLCQTIGRAAFEIGLEGLLVPSAQSLNLLDFNLVLILENAPADTGKWQLLRRK